MAYSVKPVEDTANGMTGVELTDATPAQVVQKMNQMQAAYETGTHTYLSGSLDATNIALEPGAWTEVTYDTANSTFTMSYTGPVDVAPGNGTTFDLSRVMVPLV